MNFREGIILEKKLVPEDDRIVSLFLDSLPLQIHATDD